MAIIQQYVLDMLVVKALERENGKPLTEEQLDAARMEEPIEIRGGKWVTIPVLRFPEDVLSFPDIVQDDFYNEYKKYDDESNE